VAEALLRALGLNHLKFTRRPPDACHYYRPGHTAQILCENTFIGLLGEVHPQTLESFDLKQRTYIFELNLERIVSLAPESMRIKSIPKFPAVQRDITIIIDNQIEADNVLEAVRNLGEKLIEKLRFLDAYQGDPIPPGRKSVSFRITYRAPDATLEDEIVNRIHRSITEKLLKTFDATLPSG
jgi:phenylalanyl-tRNA synthetase beta chain